MPFRQSTLFEAEPEPWELDAAREELAASVVLAEPPHGPYDYAVPPALESKLRAGQRVQVPLGKGNRPIVGYCTAVGMKPAGRHKLKPIRRLVDAEPLLSPNMLRLSSSA